jgi:oligopeptide transport system ATP-binding protein
VTLATSKALAVGGTPARSLQHGASDVVIEVADLNVALKARGGPVRVVRDLSFSLRAGARMAILGESGAGKSVTARAISGILDRRRFAVTGSIQILGREIVGLSDHQMRARRGEVGLVFQDPTRTLNPSMRVGTQIAEAIRHVRDVDRAEARERAVRLMEQVGIADPSERAMSYPHQLSGGMRQRIVIAIALALEPALLLADEATTSLDVTTQAQIMKLMRELTEQRGMTLLVITHDIALAASSVDEIMVMYAGRIVEHAPSQELITEPKMPYTRALIASVPGMSGKRQMPQAIAGSPPDPRQLRDGCPFQPRCDMAIDRCVLEAPALEVVGAGRLCACWLAQPKGRTEA